ncbi:MAG: 40S ribosomal protein S19 [Candidatus Micrarchaeia archaeon]|jgi:small subunit ribosomal protein S19e
MSVPAEPLYIVEAGKAIKLLGDKLKEDPKFAIPEWFGTVKGGPANERLPDTPEQWYARVAAILRTIAIRGPIGTQRLRNKFGGRQEHTRGRAHHKKAGGKSIRLAMQKLQEAGYVKNEPKGRVITAVGRAFITKALGTKKE